MFVLGEKWLQIKMSDIISLTGGHGVMNRIGIFLFVVMVKLSQIIYRIKGNSKSSMKNKYY